MIRELNSQEIADVSGGAGDLSYFMDKTVGYGATGVLANVLLSGVTFTTCGYGFLVGATVGAAYAGITLGAHALQIW
jgi:hypothetical protein